MIHSGVMNSVISIRSDTFVNVINYECFTMFLILLMIPFAIITLLIFAYIGFRVLFYIQLNITWDCGNMSVWCRRVSRSCHHGCGRRHHIYSSLI